MRVSLRVLFAATNTPFVQKALQNLRRLLRALLLLAVCSKHLLPYCVSSSEGFPFLTLFTPDLKPTVQSELLCNWSLLVASLRFKSMCQHCFLSFIGHPLWRKSGPVLVWSHFLCWLYLCLQYREWNVIYTTQYSTIKHNTRADEPMIRGKISLTRGISCCPYLFFFLFVLPDWRLYTVENNWIYSYICV